ncbi:hypothetical protein ACX93W_17250 [Paenibacillus sp. CAU 1782]
MSNYKKSAVAVTLIYVATVALTAVLFLVFSPLLAWNGQTALAFGSLLLAETALWLCVSGIIQKAGADHSVPANAALLTALAGYAALSVVLAFFTFLPFWAYALIHAIAALLTFVLFCLLFLSRKKITGGIAHDAERTANWSSIIASAKNAQAKLQYWEPQKRELLRKELDELVDIIQYSDPTTLPAVAEMEYSLQLDLQLVAQMLDANREQQPQSGGIRDLHQKITEAQNGVKLRNIQLAAGKS